MKHQQTKAHHEAVEAIVTLPKSTKDVVEQLDRGHNAEKECARDMLRLILASIRFLARQELALHEDVEESSNLIQILRLRAENKPEILQWIEKSARKHTSPENQSKMLEMMAH